MSGKPTNTRLSEEVVQDGFHSYLKSSLAQAKIEKLIDVDLLASAEGDLMITGPALCLYFAALRSTTEPPAVPLPRTSRSSPPIELSHENCPPAFTSFLRVWANTVPSIQVLMPEEQHDLARTICGLEPLQSSGSSQKVINGIAADLRAIAIEISQRRSFQDRFSSDLQAALDAGNAPGVGSPRKSSFVPPPVYDPSPSSSPPAVTPTRSSFDSSAVRSQSPPSSSFLSPHPPKRTPSPSTISSNPPSPTRTLLTQDSPAIEFIRETLYASLGDVLEHQPALRRLLKRDPPRAYFASVAFAILDVACTCVTSDGAIIGVLGKPLTLAECPRPLQPFMSELSTIGKLAREMEEEDTDVAIRLAQEGEREVPLSRIDRVKSILVEGVGNEGEMRAASEGRRSVEGRAVAFANRINALSLGMTKIKAFRDRQEEVFKVLAGIGL